MKTPIIIFFTTIAIIAMLVLGYVAFLKPKSSELVQPPKVNNDAADIAPAPDNTSVLAPDDTSEIDTADWKVYRNEEYGFEVKYPKDYSFEDQTKWIAGDDPASHAWYTRTNFLLSYLIWGEVNLEILNTTDKNTIMSTGGWEFIKVNGIKKIGDLDIYLYSIDSEVNNMQVILHDRKAYKFIHYVPEENFEKIISTFKFID
ncbi:hypothetical protein KKA14_17960 [bacterium]|nr:hypothetical protein [bacterium]